MDRFEGFQEFVAQHSADLMRVAYLLTGDRSDAEDLLQASLLKAAVRWESLVGSFPQAYVRRILYTEFVSGWRYRRRRPEITMANLPERAGWNESDESEHIVRRLMLAKVLGRLTPRQRAVVVLRFYEDQSEADIAVTLGCSAGTVKSQTHRALARLRGLLPDFATHRPKEAP